MKIRAGRGMAAPPAADCGKQADHGDTEQIVGERQTSRSPSPCRGGRTPDTVTVLTTK